MMARMNGGIGGIGFLDDRYLMRDGSTPLTANWDAGSFNIRAETFESDILTGTAPFVVASTTFVINLNADMVDDKHVGTSGNAIPLLDGKNTWSQLQTFDTDIQFSDNINIQLGSNLNGDVTIDFDGTNVSMDRVTGSPDFVINMPVKVTDSIEEFSLFGPATSLTTSDAKDRLVANKKGTNTSGTLRGLAAVGEWEGTSNSTAFIFGLNAGGYVLSGATANLTKTSNSGGLVGGRYFARLLSSNSTVSRATAVGAKVEIPNASVTGTITEAICFNAEGVRSRDGTITTWKGFQVENGAVSDTTNAYGLFCEKLTRGTNNFEIWLVGNGCMAFRESGNRITSDATGHLDIYADTSIDMNGDVIMGEQTGNTLQTTTLAAAATTLAITKNVITLTGDSGGNTLGTITGGIAGQILTMIFTDGNVTITDDNTHAADSIDLSAAFTSADDTVLQIVYDGTSWYEVSRSVN